MTFESFSQNGEDVVLWRALHDVEHGRYVEVGANHPVKDSVSMAFYQHAWSGITVEPDPALAKLLREQRPRDIVVEAAITPEEGDVLTLHVAEGTGLSTLDQDLAKLNAEHWTTHDVKVTTRRLDRVLEEAGWQGRDIHFMSVDTEGSERAVLESLDLRAWRPWILVVEATEPNTTIPTRDRWEDVITGADYRWCLFDGTSCFYVAAERYEELRPALSYGACCLDDYSTLDMRRLSSAASSVPALVADVSRWRAAAINRWAEVMSDKAEMERLADEMVKARAELDDLWQRYHRIGTAHHELNQANHALFLEVQAMRRSASWRITAPLRWGRRLRPRAAPAQ